MQFKFSSYIKQQRVRLQQLQVPHNNCSNQFLNYHPFTNLQKRQLLQDKELIVIKTHQDCNRELQKILTLIRKTKFKKKKLKKNTNLVFRNEMSYDLVQKIQTSISKLRKQNYSTRAITGELGLKISQIYYIEQQMNEQLEKFMNFNLNRRHINWIKKCIRQADLTDLVQSSSIYRKFLEKFVKSPQSISLKSFQIILKKHCKATYKQTIKKNRLSFGIEACEYKYQYSLKYLSLSSSNYKFIYLDETTLGHQQKQYKCWQIRYENKH